MRKRDEITPVSREAEQAAVVEKRQGGDEPAPGVFCGGFRFAYEAGGCRGAADEIEGRGDNVALRFREGFSSCQVAAEQKYPDLEVPVSQLATIIRRGVDLCKNQGYIGKISDVSNCESPSRVVNIVVMLTQERSRCRCLLWQSLWRVWVRLWRLHSLDEKEDERD